MIGNDDNSSVKDKLNAIAGQFMDPFTILQIRNSEVQSMTDSQKLILNVTGKT